MWHATVPWYELILRAGIVYAFMLVLLRITGKRQVGQLAPFELVLLLVLSNSVQNAMNAGDNSVTAGLILATTLVALNSAVSWATFRSKRMESLVEGRPVLLVHNGEVLERNLAKARLTHHELHAALRRAGFNHAAQVHTAVLENNGSISVTGRNNHEHETTGAPPAAS